MCKNGKDVCFHCSRHLSDTMLAVLIKRGTDISSTFKLIIKVELIYVEVAVQRRREAVS